MLRGGTRLSTRTVLSETLRNRSMSLSMRQSRPIDWKASAPAPLSPSTTFASQQNLPKLPVPELHDTLARLKDSLAPIAWNASEYNAVVKRIDAFAAEQGPELHSRLLKRAEQTPHWLEEWWDSASYNGYRESVVVNVSYYYGFDSPPSHLSQTPAGRAAGIARAAMLFRRQLKQGLLAPETTKDGPVCMDTYRWMFDCCRIPAEDGVDWSRSYAREGDTGDSGHIIVMRKNRIWKVFAADNGRILSTQEFERQIQYIYDHTLEEYPGVGVLTASNRDIWAKDYSMLSASPHNASMLEEIESSAFIINLDTAQPHDPVSHSRTLWHGDVVRGVSVGLRNRWVDKPLQFVIFDNSYAGFMGEHSIMDGTPTARMCDVVLDMLYDPAFDHGSGSSTVTPKPLDWEMSSAISVAIKKADEAARALIDSQVLGFFETSYGKAAIKKFKVSPDSWAQMIIQLAYHRLLGPNQGRQGGTYEAASTRRFFKGRTEAIRVVTRDSQAWVKSMDDKAVDLQTRKELFDKATTTHVSSAINAGQGQGVDRHLFGLKNLLLPGEKRPELFYDAVLKRSSNWVLSTSAIFSKHFPVYGWGEVVPEGFGIAYMTGYDDRLVYTVTSRKEMPNARFVDEIRIASEDVYSMHEELHEANYTRSKL